MNAITIRQVDHDPSAMFKMAQAIAAGKLFGSQDPNAVFTLMLLAEPTSEQRLQALAAEFEALTRASSSYRVLFPRAHMGPMHVTFGSINTSSCDVGTALRSVTSLVTALSSKTYSLGHLHCSVECQSVLPAKP